MIAILLFSLGAALLVYLAGRADRARDPRLTVLALGLIALFPLLWLLMPKVGLLPAVEVSGAIQASGGTGLDLRWFAGGLWGLVSVVAFVRLFLAARGLSKWRGRSVLVGREDGVEIRMLGSLKGPVAAGVFKPVVFVPAEWEAWSSETRRIVLEHELAHHRRRDPLWRWVGQIACAMNPWNPVAFWMARRLALQCEHACDSEVLGKGIPAGKYARVLCDFAEARGPSGPVLAMSVGSALEERVRRVMHRPTGAKQGSTGVMVLIGVAITMAAVLASVGRARKADLPVTQREVEQRFAAEAFPAGGDVAPTEGAEQEFATPPK